MGAVAVAEGETMKTVNHGICIGFVPILWQDARFAVDKFAVDDRHYILSPPVAANPFVATDFPPKEVKP